ncbi:MAG: DMT family transporter [Anaerovorax sp.]
MPKKLNIFARNAKKIVLLAVVAGAMSPIFTRLIEAPAVVIGFYRLAFTVPFFLVTVLGWHGKELAAISKKELLGCALGGVFLAGHFFSWFTALKLTTIASATVLGLTHPMVILVITALILKEKTNVKAVIGVLVAFLGAAIISGSDYSFSGQALMGDFFALCAAVCMALYFLTGRKYRKTVNAPVYVFVVFSACWLSFTVGMLLTKTPFVGYAHTDYLWILAMALICQVCSHAVFNWLLGYVEALYIATWENAEAVIATIIGIFLFGEIPTVWQIVGGTIVICGLLYYNKHERNDGENGGDLPCPIK